MALVSPGVEVTIIDQSQYLPAASNSVPFLLLATAQNKANAAGTGIAPATTAANANKLYQVTSQRDLVNLFGNPFFYKTSNGTPIQGYELNEYGLLAAYSLLGTTNRCYILRADVDLASLVGQVGRPAGAPADGTYWLDSTNSTWGIYEFNRTTGKFVAKTPLVITDEALLINDTPIASIGAIGDYAINAIPATEDPLNNSAYFYKDENNTWVEVGTPEWRSTIPTVIGSVASPTLVTGEEFTINFSGAFTVTVTVPSASVNDLNDYINALQIPAITANTQNGKLSLTSNQSGSNKSITLANVGSGTALTRLGITAGTYYQADMFYGTSAQMPLWTSSQSQPHPTRSVWIKVGQAGGGLNPIVSRYDAATASYYAQNFGQYTSDYAAIADLDATGGMAIPAGTLYAQYNFSTITPLASVYHAPIYFWRRTATGPTVVTGDNITPTFTNGDVLYVRVSTPGSDALSNLYTVNITGTDADAFLTAWGGAGIPNTTATQTTSGAIQLTHTKGGVIVLDDAGLSGVSNGVIADGLGLVQDVTPSVKLGPMILNIYNNVSPTAGNAVFNITVAGRVYLVGAISNGGSGYSVGDTITIAGDELGGTTTANDLTLVVTEVSGGAVTGVAYSAGSANPQFSTILSNWEALDYVANEGAPQVDPVDGTAWFYSVIDEVDIMVKKGSAWVGYRTTAYDSSGNPAATGSNATDPNGPIISASEPALQSDGTALVYGDLWIDTSDLENYPVINRWQQVSGLDQWVLIDNTDQTSNDGVLFADARWATSGSVDPIDDPIPTIKSMLTSSYTDLDAPEPSLYPQGMMLFNTRRSGYNVKKFQVNYFNGNDFPDQVLPTAKNAWVSASGLQSNGAAFMGRKAQRNMVTQALKAAIGTNQSIREEDTFFNLISAPNYPELQPDMVTLNNDRNNTAYIIGDTPLRLNDQATDLVNWATNAAGATSTGEEGLVTRDEYLGVFYPSGIATDLTGASVVVPSSHMMLRTFLRNDQVAYPWFAAAGTRRGTIDNATNIGYLNGTTGEFQTIKNRMGIRDVLYSNQINPLAYFTGVGLLNYGNKNTKDTQSAMDRTNVSRLVAYIRERLQVAARPFVFEPNDSITRQEITGVVESLFIDLVAKRGLYDYLVVCDESNNTPARIDRNELWIDIAIEPVKAAEFIYIPVRILNTGEIGG